MYIFTSKKQNKNPTHFQVSTMMVENPNHMELVWPSSIIFRCLLCSIVPVTSQQPIYRIYGRNMQNSFAIDNYELFFCFGPPLNLYPAIEQETVIAAQQIKSLSFWFRITNCPIGISTLTIFFSLTSK